MANLIKQRITTETNNTAKRQATILQDVLPSHYFNISFLSFSNSCAIIYLKGNEVLSLDLMTAPYYSIFPLEKEQGYWYTSWEPFDLQISKESCSTLPERELLIFSLRTCNCPVIPRHQQIIYSSIKIKANHADWWALVFKPWLQDSTCIFSNLNKVLILQGQYHWSMVACPYKAEKTFKTSKWVSVSGLCIDIPTHMQGF